MSKNYDPEVVNIVYASDDRFAEILGVSVVSLFDSSKDVKTINLFILDSGISAENKDRLAEVCNKYQRSLPVYIKAVDICSHLSMDVSVDRGSLSQYARLFISKDLPADMGRVLYMDCDIIVNDSIKKLWDTDLEGRTIGALMDAFSKYYRVNIDLEPNDIMFNSGVMLIDLDKWKQNNIEDKLIAFIKKHNGKIQQGDQGVLNAVLSRDTYCFEPKFNAVTIYFDFTYKEMMFYRKPPEFYTEQQVKEAVENPCIVHFTTSFLSKRPWMEGCKHKYVGLWMKYKNQSPWRDMPLWQNKKSEIFGKMPRFIMLPIASVCQVYLRPFKNYIKREK
ncbi:MAG: glycosyltransferase family 8 protein [Firmicutes bacterium]|nr:glycosyltransferase family 8 protein [Bacillota bacterium]